MCYPGTALDKIRSHRLIDLPHLKQDALASIHDFTIPDRRPIAA
jgi:hypothetical protein